MSAVSIYATGEHLAKLVDSSIKTLSAARDVLEDEAHNPGCPGEWAGSIYLDYGAQRPNVEMTFLVELDSDATFAWLEGRGDSELRGSIEPCRLTYTLDPVLLDGITIRRLVEFRFWGLPIAATVRRAGTMDPETGWVTMTAADLAAVLRAEKAKATGGARAD